MLTNSPDHPIHHPHNPDKFEFDEEVTKIFDDMAVRSIPLYNEARELTVEIAYTEYLKAREERRDFTVLDIGASTGAFFRDFWRRAGYRINEEIPLFNPIAVELSKPMHDRLLDSFPYVRVQLADALMIDNLRLRCDIINMSYVAQFIPHEDRDSLYSKIFRSLKDEGIFFLSQKDDVSGAFSEFYTQRYMDFRKQNGYSQEEIDAKTRALRGSMWCEMPEITHNRLTAAGFSTITELCRWLQFSTILVHK